jgi:hypothetical protein
VVVSSELWEAGTTFTVVANTAQTAADAQGAAYTGTHPVGSTVAVQGSANGEPAYLAVRGVQPAEVVVLVKEY